MKSNTAIVCLSPYFGGMEMNSLRLYHLLSSEMTVYLIIRNNTKLEEYANAEIPEGHIHSISFRWKFGPSLVFNLRKFLKTRDIRNVIYFGASELVSLFCSCLHLDVNLIVRHGTTKSSTKKDIYHKIIYSTVTWHVANSDHILKNVEAIIPLSKQSRLKRIYLSRNIHVQKIPKTDRIIRIINVARIVSGKGQLDAVMALKRLKDKEIDFEAVFLGHIDDKDYYQKINTFVTDNQLAERVHFIGHVNNILEYLKKADIFLFPSYGEGLPNALVECMAVGLVPITYDNTVFPEFGQMGFHILLTKDRDIEMLAENLSLVAMNLEENLEKSKFNVEKCRIFFSPDVEKENYLSILI